MKTYEWTYVVKDYSTSILETIEFGLEDNFDYIEIVKLYIEEVEISGEKLYVITVEIATDEKVTREIPKFIYSLVCEYCELSKRYEELVKKDGLI